VLKKKRIKKRKTCSAEPPAATRKNNPLLLLLMYQGYKDHINNFLKGLRSWYLKDINISQPVFPLKFI
jgi:hypothetical protein